MGRQGSRNLDRWLGPHIPSEIINWDYGRYSDPYYDVQWDGYMASPTDSDGNPIYPCPYAYVKTGVHVSDPLWPGIGRDESLYAEILPTPP